MAEEKQNIEDLVNQKVLSGEYIVRPKDSQSQQTTYTAQDIFKGSLSPEYEGTAVAPDATATGIDPAAQVDGTNGQLSPDFLKAYRDYQISQQLQQLVTQGIMAGEHDMGKPPPPVGVWANLKDLAQKRSFQKIAGTLATAALGGPDRGKDVAEFGYHFGQIEAADRADQQRTDALKRQQRTDEITRRQAETKALDTQTKIEKNAFDRAVVLANTLTRPQWRSNPYAAQLLATAGLPPDIDLSERTWKADPETKMIRPATREEIIAGDAESLALAKIQLDSIHKIKKPWTEEVAERFAYYEEHGISLNADDKRKIVNLAPLERTNWQTIEGEDGKYYSWNPVTKSLHYIGLRSWRKGDKQQDKYPKIIANATSGYNDVKELIGVIQDIGLRQSIIEGSLGFGSRGQNIQNLKSHIADKIGRLRSGGAINKEEEARFIGYLSMGVTAFLWGTGEGTINNLRRLQNEFKIVGMRIDGEFHGKITGEQWDEELTRENEQQFGTSPSHAEYKKGRRKITSDTGLVSGAKKQVQHIRISSENLEDFAENPENYLRPRK